MGDTDNPPIRVTPKELALEAWRAARGNAADERFEGWWSAVGIRMAGHGTLRELAQAAYEGGARTVPTFALWWKTVLEERRLVSEP